MSNDNSNRTSRCYITLLLIILIHFFLLVHSDTKAEEKTSEFIFNPHSEYWPTEGWRTATPESQGMNSELLAEMFETINSDYIDINSILIVRNGYIITEANISHPDTKYPIYSSTKSFTSAIIGIALAKGYIKNIDQKIIDFFPEFLKGNTESKKTSITLRHLLTMSSGFEWPELDTSYTNPENPALQMMKSNNWAEFVLNKPVIMEPGSVFNYNSGCSHLLLAVLKQTGLNVADFAQKQLFTPLGISSQQYIWDTDPHQIPNGSHGLKMRLRDIAKFGYLYLKGGHWDGKQIIPESWVKESTKSHIKMNTKINIANYYGYQWYIHPFGFHSLGVTGQYIFVIPELELVVVFTSSIIAKSKLIIPIDLVKTYIIPAVKASKPLPENEEARSNLKSNIESFNELSF